MPSSALPEAAALTHLEWQLMVDRVFDGLSSVAATHRFVDEDGRVTPDSVLPRSDDPQEVSQRFGDLRALEVLEEAARRGDAEVPNAVGPVLGPVLDVAPLLERAQRSAALDIEELCAVHDLVRAAADVSAMVRAGVDALRDGPEAQRGDREVFEALAVRLSGMAPPPTLLERLDRSLERGGEPRLSDDASEALRSLRRKAQSARQSLTTSADRLVRTQSVGKALADRYWTDRDGRVVLPVRSDAFSRAGGSGTVSGIIHGSSKSGATLFVEPHALVESGNAWREATMAVRVEERRILAKLAREVGDAAEDLEQALEAVVWLDLVHARLKVGRALAGVEPRVCAPSEGAALEVLEARHPLMALAGIEVVPNDLIVRVGSALVISGPNAGGKTVALKTLGLCVLMAQAGLRLPTVEPAQVPLFRHVVTDVGDDQSIAGGLSTFSAHMTHVIEALDHAAQDGVGTLVLLDEVAVGTDPEQGAALAEALLRELVSRGATQVITTHYERLKLLASDDAVHFANAAVGYDFDAMRPTFTVRMGAPGASSALVVAERLGLPLAVLERARSMLDDTRLQVDALLRDVEAQRERLTQERETVAAQGRALQQARDALERRQRREEETAASKRRKAHEVATVALRDLETEIKRRRKALRKSEIAVVGRDGTTDTESRTFAREARAELGQARPASPEPEAPPPPGVAVGDRVRVESLGADGEVLEVKGDRIRVQLPLAKVSVRLSELRTTAAGRPKAAVSRAKVELPAPASARRFFGTEAAPVEARHDNVIDVRGNRAHEAVTMLEVFCDRAIAEDVDVVIVRHGHGSGALRKAVREHLGHLSYAKRHRGGLPIEGGDAVTVVWISP